MTINQWEQRINKLYTFQKCCSIDELRPYLTNALNYGENFCPSGISEGQLNDDDFYAAYVFDEHQILGSDIVVYSNTGWTTTIVLLQSQNKVDIDDYYICGMNGFSRNQVRTFLQLFNDDCKHRNM